jgi:hypothetical protein
MVTQVIEFDFARRGVSSAVDEKKKKQRHLRCSRFSKDYFETSGRVRTSACQETHRKALDISIDSTVLVTELTGVAYRSLPSRTRFLSRPKISKLFEIDSLKFVTLRCGRKFG